MSPRRFPKWCSEVAKRLREEQQRLGFDNPTIDEELIYWMAVKIGLDEIKKLDASDALNLILNYLKTGKIASKEGSK